MANFEKVFEDMEVKTGEIDAMMDGVYQGSIDQDEVNSLFQEVADANGMQF